MVDEREAASAGMIVGLRRWPLGRMLLLSLGLHLAVIMIVQPRVFPPVYEVVVISARLQDESPPPDRPPAKATPVPMVRPEVPPTTLAVVTPSPSRDPDLTPPPPAPSPTAVTVPTPVQSVSAPAAPARPQGAEAPALPSVAVLADGHWYEARQLDMPPSPVARIEPVYPSEARRRGVEGWVKLKILIDEFGVVREIGVEEGSPPGLFDHSALEAFGQSRYLPARKDGRPVRALVYRKVRYELND
jgi:protein TonB